MNESFCNEFIRVFETIISTKTLLLFIPLEHMVNLYYIICIYLVKFLIPRIQSNSIKSNCNSCVFGKGKILFKITTFLSYFKTSSHLEFCSFLIVTFKCFFFCWKIISPSIKGTFIFFTVINIL